MPHLPRAYGAAAPFPRRSRSRPARPNRQTFWRHPMRPNPFHAAFEAARRSRLIRPASLALFTLLLTPTVTQAQAPAVYDAPERIAIKSQVLGEERTVLVRVPAAYARGTERFPVL